jgi:hypothetical protein
MNRFCKTKDNNEEYILVDQYKQPLNCSKNCDTTENHCYIMDYNQVIENNKEYQRLDKTDLYKSTDISCSYENDGYINDEQDIKNYKLAKIINSVNKNIDSSSDEFKYNEEFYPSFYRFFNIMSYENDKNKVDKNNLKAIIKSMNTFIKFKEELDKVIIYRDCNYIGGNLNYSVGSYVLRSSDNTTAGFPFKSIKIPPEYIVNLYDKHFKDSRKKKLITLSENNECISEDIYNKMASMEIINNNLNDEESNEDEESKDKKEEAKDKKEEAKDKKKESKDKKEEAKDKKEDPYKFNKLKYKNNEDVVERDSSLTILMIFLFSLLFIFIAIILIYILISSLSSN